MQLKDFIAFLELPSDSQTPFPTNTDLKRGLDASFYDHLDFKTKITFSPACI